MIGKKNKPAVLFIIFNKKEETKKVFQTIRNYQPTQLFIAADGPRENIAGEKEKCEYIKNWLWDQIDWECDIKTLFRTQNVGCGRGPAEAITWFFEQVNEGIILEDDCLPNDTFFKFCEENLEKYREDKRISIISGNNFQPIQPMKIKEEYYFSVFPSTNGWATWKRTWEEFDFYISSCSSINKEEILNFIFKEKKYKLWWNDLFNWIYRERPMDMWDFQFHYLSMSRKQLAVIPKANLVSNIGYGPDATHSKDPNCYFANVPTHDFNFPLVHPNEIKRNYDADLFIQNNLFGEYQMVKPIKKIKRWVKKHVLSNMQMTRYYISK
jgi:hypothetical protein